MAASAPPSPLDRLRARFDALPLDRAPLRRAGVLTVLLVLLLVLGKVFSPRATTVAERQDLRSATEEVSGAAEAPRSASPWTGGRVLAILFLLTGGGVAYWLHRRSPARQLASGSTLEVLETHPLGPGQSLRLVACGDEVMLLSVTGEGATLLRHWPRTAFASSADDAPTLSFADALAAMADAPTAPTAASPMPVAPPPADTDLPTMAPDPAIELVTDTTATPAHYGSDLLSRPVASPTGGILAERESLTVEVPDHARGALFPTRAPRQFSAR